MKSIILKGSLIVTFVASLLVGASAFGDSNQKNGVALEGYDVVAYFQNYEREIERGTKGSKKFSTKILGITYYFVSEENKDTFDADPEKYIPAYGGWCAWAMAQGQTGVPVNYNTFLIEENVYGQKSLYLFYNSWGNNTKKKWLEHFHHDLILKADETWQKIIKVTN